MRRRKGPLSVIGSGISIIFYSLFAALTGLNLPRLGQSSIEMAGHNQAMFGVCMGLVLVGLGGIWLWFSDE